MCGIGAIFGQNITDGEAMIKKSLEAIRHRGYSLYEMKAFDDCVLGANRLEIVDAPNGRQPQTNEDKTVFVVLNGEIFNHKELRAELVKKKHRFRTDSDTEVLAHLWEEYGPKMTKKLDTEMFAFFIYDKRKNSFFAARDPYGVKPLYYAIDSLGNWHFASEIKQLVQFNSIEEVKEFPYGHQMLNGELVQYHNIPRPQERAQEKTEDVILNVRRLFDEAVRKRVDTDLPIGVFFSGGIDSAAVLATARKYHKNVTAVTIGRPDSSDIMIAKRYCDEFEVPLVTFEPPSEEELAKLAPKFVRISESFEPKVVVHTAVYYYLSELARKNGFRVVLCGEGADEIFGGYKSFERVHPQELSNLFYEFAAEISRSQFQRLDRATMSHTIETRVPFFDTEFVDYVLGIRGELKITAPNGRKVAKWILREAMRDRLPSYIVEREKIPLNAGAGYRGNMLVDGFLHKFVKHKMSDEELGQLKRENASWNLSSNLDAYYFGLYAEYLFTKATFNKNRIYRFMPRYPIWRRALYFVSEFRLESVKRLLEDGITLPLSSS